MRWSQACQRPTGRCKTSSKEDEWPAKKPTRVEVYMSTKSSGLCILLAHTRSTWNSACTSRPADWMQSEASSKRGSPGRYVNPAANMRVDDANSGCERRRILGLQNDLSRWAQFAIPSVRNEKDKLSALGHDMNHAGSASAYVEHFPLVVLV